MAVVLIGTLDTKGAEIAFVRDRIRAAGLDTWVMDAGVYEQSNLVPEFGRDEVFANSGLAIHHPALHHTRGQLVAGAARGVDVLIRRLYADGKVDGVFGLGGSAGTAIGTAAMRAIPYGIPKVMVSTMASGHVGPYVGVRDICMIHSVTDLCGLNRFTRKVLENAANAMIGMCTATPLAALQEKPLVAATMFGVTTPCVSTARQLVEAGGFEVLVFHATGSGGRTMEAMIRDGLIAGVLDLTTTELADELVGGVLTAGPDRLTAASLKGVPQVISLGALDMVNFGPPDTVPARFEGRRFHQHNPTVTLMRTTPEENDRLGKSIVEKACAARGPVAILMPLKGVSAIDVEGGPFWWPEADRALFQSIRDSVAPPVKLVEFDLHINDPAFARAAAEALLAML